MDEIWDLLPLPMQEKLQGYVEGFWSLLPNFILALVFLLFVWLFAALVGYFLPRALEKAHVRGALIKVARMVALVVIWVVGVLIAATIAFPTMTIGRLFAAAGIGGIAIAFAAKDTLENFFAGIMILIREPFQLGDFIECEDCEGKVETITIRDTRIRTTDGMLIVAPNAMFFNNPVTVLTAGEKRRTTVICGVAYGEDVDEARSVIEKAVREVDSVDNDLHDVQIFAQEFADSSINFEVTWWTGSEPVDIRRSKDKVVAAVKAALDKAGIEIPFPYRTMTFKEPLTIARESGDEASDDSDSERPARSA